ncbi:MAG: TadE/TadG family type IV pilus assembly protein [Acidimicrobiia bacterium]
MNQARPSGQPGSRWGIPNFRDRKDRGANLVEFAMLAPFLILLLLGIIEFGYFIGEWNTVKHGAHEAARLAAVNDSSLVTNTCDSMDLHSGGTVITLEFTDGSSQSIGDQGNVVVTASNIDSLSGLGLIEVFLPSSIKADADFRLEQKSTNWGTTTSICP